jgi:polyferredoxin
MKIPRSVLKYRYASLRPWLAQPMGLTLFMLSPVLGLFRFDVISQHLVFLGRVYPLEANGPVMWVPVTFFGGVLLIALVSLLYGRLFCGWVCPHNTLTEWTRPLRAWVGREAMPPGWTRQWRRLPSAMQTRIAWGSPVFGMMLTWGLAWLLAAYFVPLDWQWRAYASGHPHLALVWGHGLLTLIGLFLLYCGHDFCRNACPYGMAQSISAYQSGKWRPMELQFSGADVASTCGGCTGCQQVCPVQLDPRLPNLAVGQFAGCFNCGLCIDACKSIQAHRQRPGWLSFQMPLAAFLQRAHVVKPATGGDNRD